MPCSHKAYSLPPQVAKKGIGDHLLTLLLGHWRLMTENQWSQETQIGKMETNSSTYGERDLQALFSASGKCICFCLKIYRETSSLAGRWKPTAGPQKTGHMFNLLWWGSLGTCFLGENKPCWSYSMTQVHLLFLRLGR